MSLDDKLRNIGRNRFSAPVVESSEKKKRGRPRKQPKEPIDMAEIERVHAQSRAPVAPAPIEMAEEEDPDGPPPPEPIEQSPEQEIEAPPDIVVDTSKKDTLAARKRAAQIILNLQKRCFAIGTQMVPDPHLHTLAQMDTEIELLNNELDSNHGSAFVKNLACGVIAPIVTVVMDEINNYLEKIGKARTLDLTGLDTELYNSWNDVFAAPLAQIAANNPEWFSSSPYGALFDGAMSVTLSCNARNIVNKQKATIAEMERRQALDNAK